MLRLCVARTKCIFWPQDHVWILLCNYHMASCYCKTYIYFLPSTCNSGPQVVLWAPVRVCMCVRVTTLVKYMKYNLVKQTHSFLVGWSTILTSCLLNTYYYMSRTFLSRSKTLKVMLSWKSQGSRKWERRKTEEKGALTNMYHGL